MSYWGLSVLWAGMGGSVPTQQAPRRHEQQLQQRRLGVTAVAYSLVVSQGVLGGSRYQHLVQQARGRCTGLGQHCSTGQCLLPFLL